MAALTTDDGDERAGDLPALVKWGARRFEVAVRPGAPGARLKARLCALTGVPPARQKVMCGREARHGWKGSLGDDAVYQVPYKHNRAIILNGHRFHRTDSLDFKPGFRNHRINLTFLFRNRSDDTTCALNP